MTLDHFWNWSLAQYRSEATKALLLSLQASSGLVIMEALFACWLGSLHRQWQQAHVDRMVVASTPWVRAVVLPLRETRVQWKQDAALYSARAHLLELEVEAERHLATLIWDAVMNTGVAPALHPQTMTAELMEANLSSLSVFSRGKYVSENRELVALLDQAT